MMRYAGTPEKKMSNMRRENHGESDLTRRRFIEFNVESCADKF